MFFPNAIETEKKIESSPPWIFVRNGRMKREFRDTFLAELHSGRHVDGCEERREEYSDERPCSGTTQMMVAARNDDVSFAHEIVAAVIEHAPEELYDIINAKDCKGWTPLMHAADSGSVAFIEFLVSLCDAEGSRTCDVNHGSCRLYYEADRPCGTITALYLAVQRYLPRCILVLIREGKCIVRNSGDSVCLIDCDYDSSDEEDEEDEEEDDSRDCLRRSTLVELLRARKNLDAKKRSDDRENVDVLYEVVNTILDASMGPLRPSTMMRAMSCIEKGPGNESELFENIVMMLIRRSAPVSGADAQRLLWKAASVGSPRVMREIRKEFSADAHRPLKFCWSSIPLNDPEVLRELVRSHVTDAELMTSRAMVIRHLVDTVGLPLDLVRLIISKA